MDRLPRPLFLALVLPALLLGSCTCGSGVNQGDLNLISLDEEWRMGNELAGQIAQELTLVKDPQATAYLDAVGQRLAEQTELSDRPWTFHLVDAPTINAFATPGGHVYVHTGLVAAAADASELAGVMGHEVAHGIARHSTERLTKAYGLNAIAGLLLGDNPGLIEQIAAQLAGSGVMAKFSRDDEREADRLGVRFVTEAGYDPRGMATLFETMLEAREARPNAVEQFFATHPLTEERIRDVRAVVEQLDVDPETLRQHEEGFQELRRLVR